MNLAAFARRFALACLAAAAALGPVAHAAPTAHTAPATVPVLLLSDIHFDPFRDPAKFSQLLSTPPEKWAEIFRAPDSPSAAAGFAQLQKTCNARGADTSWPLLQSALAEATHTQPHPLFITIAGDLSVHQFDCRFHAFAPKATPAEYATFASAVVAFVTLEVRRAFPGTPVFVALGNNDSGCGDYREDIDSPFLQSVSEVTAEAALSKPDRQRIRHEYGPEGDYSVPLPHPIAHTRLLVIQDIFQSARYNPCTASSNRRAGADAQLAWLRHELHEAREKHEHVWIMAHIPPGIDAYATVLTQKRDVCKGEAPVTFLENTALGELLDEYASTVRLALFAHTHMDEVRLFRSADGAFAPGKLTPSISPVNGNQPAFTVASVDPVTATLVDYAVTVASDNAGSSWREEYRYSSTYHQPDFSGASVARLTAELSAPTTEAASFRDFFSAGDKGLRALGLHLIWPSYACSLTQTTAAAYRTCACPKP